MNSPQKINKKTKKKRRLLIIESSSSSKSKKTSMTERKSSMNITKKKLATAAPKKKRILIIESSSSSLPALKNDKIDLKISPEVTKMAVTLPTGRLNETFIELMEKLSEIMLKQGEPFRARAYQKAQETIMTYTDDITSPNDLKDKPGIGPTIMEKLNEYVQTGTLKILEREKNNPINILTDVYGIGPKKAKELVEGGVTSIAQLRENQSKVLNDTQRVGLKYYEDILKRIPRAEIDEYNKIFQIEMNFVKLHVKNSGDVAADYEIVGSYRRGAQNSGDIDVIVTSSSPKIFVDLIDNLIKQKVILEVLSRGPSKCLVIAKIPSSNTPRRVDFLYSSPDEFPFSILYFTGSKIFNTVMRHQALTMGLTMNEHGLYTFTGKKKGEKVDHVFKTEKDIFDYLQLEYKGPTERIDGRAVIQKGSTVLKEKEVNEEKEKEEKEEKEEKKEEKEEKKGTLKRRTLIAPVKNRKFIITRKVKSVLEKGLEEKGLEEKGLEEKGLEEKGLEGLEEKGEQVDPAIKALIVDFKKNGITVLESLNENQLTAILKTANILYRNFTPIMTDNEYDIIQDYTAEKFPMNMAIHEIGAPVEKNKAVLPYKMASMDKIKPDTEALLMWMKKYTGPYVLSCKLDGVSGLYTTEGPVPKLYTRGDGTVGQDISHLIPHLRLPKTKGLVIRGEFILPKAIFDAKYKTQFANPRNMVSGIVNQKTITASVKDLHFVTYEVIKPVLKPSEQMDFLGTIDVESVLYKVENSGSLTNNLLSATLVEWRTNYLYEIDGVIVTDDKIYERTSGNPDHAFAFKMVLSDQVAEAKVVDVIWTASKDGYLKPRVQIEPIRLGGVRIEYATGFNGSFINDNKVGIGAVIELIRSGDVIPHIRKVIVPAEQAKMPSVSYKWNDTHVDVMLEDIGSDETVKEKNITGFFRGIGVDGLSEGNVARIIGAGYDTIPKIINMSVADLLTVKGFKITTATKIHDGIKEKLLAAPLVTIMSASNLFGRGFSGKKSELILEAYPDILVSKESDAEKVKKIAAIKGMASKTAESFVQHIEVFVQFMTESDLLSKLEEALKKDINTSHPLFGKTVIMTGFRDATIIDKLKDVGAKLGANVSKNTFIVLVKDLQEDTGKAAEAKKLGVTLMTPEEFTQKYL